jgi:hypothetical protein
MERINWRDAKEVLYENLMENLNYHHLDIPVDPKNLDSMFRAMRVLAVYTSTEHEKISVENILWDCLVKLD